MLFKTTAVTDDDFASARSSELGRELGGMAEAHGANTVTSKMSPEKLRCVDDQVRCCSAGSAWDRLTQRQGLVTAEMGAHPGASMCSTIEDPAGKGSATQLEGMGSPLADPADRRVTAKTLERDQPQHLLFWWRCGAYRETVRAVDQPKHEEHERKRRLQNECIRGRKQPYTKLFTVNIHISTPR